MSIEKHLFQLIAFNLINGFLAFVFSVIVARELAVGDFGTFALIVAIGSLLPLALDMGSGPVLITRMKHKKTRLPCALLRFRLFLGVLILGIAWLISLFAQNHQIAKIIILIGGLTAGSLLLSMDLAIAQGESRFLKYGVLVISANSLRCLVLLLVFSISNLRLDLIVIIYTLAPLAIAAMFQINSKWWGIRINWKYLRVALPWFFSKTSWSAAVVLLTVIVMRIDIFILSVLSDAQNLGYYGAAVQVASFFVVIGGAVSGVLLPYQAEDNGMSNILLSNYIRNRFWKLLVVGLLLSLVLSFVTPVMFGEKFRGTEIVIFLLCIAYLMSLLNSPFYVAHQVNGKFRFLAGIHISQVVALSLVGGLLAKEYGAIGMASVALLTRVGTTTICGTYALKPADN